MAPSTNAFWTLSLADAMRGAAVFGARHYTQPADQRETAMPYWLLSAVVAAKKL